MNRKTLRWQKYPIIRRWFAVAGLCAGWACLGAAPPVAAQSPETKGLDLARKVDQANEGYKAEESSMELVLINAHGDRTTRKMNSQVVETPNDGDRMRIEFEWPADVKGARMLTFTHKKGDDDQWLFLPAIKRVKRIASSNKSGSFMGSEFSYEDLNSQEIEKFKHKLLGEETLDGRKAWKVERIPVDPHSGYSKMVTWIDQGYMNAAKIEYYDRKGELLKTSKFSAYQQHGKMWRVGKIEIVNHQTKKSSTLIWSKRKVGGPIAEARFSSDELDD